MNFNNFSLHKKFADIHSNTKTTLLQCSSPNLCNPIISFHALKPLNWYKVKLAAHCLKNTNFIPSCSFLSPHLKFFSKFLKSNYFTLSILASLPPQISKKLLLLWVGDKEVPGKVVEIFLVTSMIDSKTDKERRNLVKMISKTEISHCKIQKCCKMLAKVITY